jgi:chaperone required for assembly of F1-ATPase
MVATFSMSTDAFLSMFGAREAHEPRDPMKAAQAGMKSTLPRRFYSDVAIQPAPEGWLLLLDGRTARTPARRALAMPTAPLAEALAAEWRAQGEHIVAATMPLTRLLNTALDGVAANMAEVRAEIVSFAGSDLVCYRADAPEALCARQAAHWDPVLAFAREALGARFLLSGGIVHVAQPEAALGRVATAVEAVAEPLALAALAAATTLTGSALIALALAHGALGADAAWDAGHVDEIYQASVWGQDEEAAQRLAARRIDFDAAAAVLRDRRLAG